jgi:hypothetical protein
MPSLCFVSPTLLPATFIYRYTSEQRGKEERNKTNKSDVEEEGRRNIGKVKRKKKVAVKRARRVSELKI